MHMHSVVMTIFNPQCTRVPRVMVLGLCVSVCLTDYFSQPVSLYVEVKVPVCWCDTVQNIKRRDFTLHTLFKSYGVFCFCSKCCPKLSQSKAEATFVCSL